MPKTMKPVIKETTGINKVEYRRFSHQGKPIKIHISWFIDHYNNILQDGSLSKSDLATFPRTQAMVAALDGSPPNDHMFLAVASCLCCACPCGIVSIFHAVRVGDVINLPAASTEVHIKWRKVSSGWGVPCQQLWKGTVVGGGEGRGKLVGWRLYSQEFRLSLIC